VSNNVTWRKPATALLRQERRHPPGPRPDFQHDVERPEFGIFDDEFEQIQIDEKILPEIAARMKPAIFKQPHELRTGLAL
jgi:hypothetical protein